MRKLLLFTLLTIFFLYADAYASIYGILSGKVVDQDGKPLKGATIKIIGTTRGAYVRENDGSYSIVNIVAGDYEVTYSFAGMQTVTKKVTISADQRTELNVTLSVDAIKLEGVEVIGKKLMEVDAIGKVQSRSNDEIRNTAREGIAGAIGVSAGVISTGGGFSIRGNRSNETAIRVDNMDFTNQLTGSFGVSGSGYFPMVSSYAIQELQVITGGFSAEYGDVTGGLANSIVQIGKTNSYDGWLRYRTDFSFLNGSQSTDMKLIREGVRYKAIESGEGAKLQGANEHRFEFGVGGPVPLLSNSTFYITGSYFTEKYRDNGYEILDPWGMNLGQMPDNHSWVRSITPKLQFALTPEILLTVGAHFGISSFEFSGWSWLYSNDEGWIYDKQADGSFNLRTDENGNPVTNGIPERIAKQNVLDQVVTNVYAYVNHQINSNSFYELRISYTENNDYSAPRIGFENPGLFSTFNIWQPRDEYTLSGSTLIAGKDRVIDNYTMIQMQQRTKDGYGPFDLVQRNPLTGYYEGAANSGGTFNPYGLRGNFYTSGSGGGFSYREGGIWAVDGSYTHDLKIDRFTHTLKTGFQVGFFELHRHYNGMPYDGLPFYDVFTDGRFGGNLYTDNPKVLEETNKPKNILKIGYYLQDQIKFKGVTISAGLRLDYFNPYSKYRLPSDFFTPIGSETGFADADPKFQISPRINVNYPITENSLLRISYGTYFKMPEPQFLFDNFNAEQVRGNATLGNPNVEAQKTNMYEVEFSQSLSSDFIFSSNIYYTDKFNELGVKYYFAVPDRYTQYAVTEYKTSRGIEFALRLLQSRERNFSFDLSYTLSKVTGTSNGVSTNASVPIDPYTDLPAFPMAEYVLGIDIPHFAKGNFNLYWLDDQGPSIGGIKPLENARITLTSQWRVGSPYTRAIVGGTSISEINAERQPSVFTLDARISKEFKLSDIFGDAAGKNSRVEFSFDIFNLLNLTPAVGVYSITNDPIDDGVTFERKIGDFASTPYYKDARYESPETYAPDQYDLYGNRLYSTWGDHDKNGIVTQSEKYESYMQYVETIVRHRGNFMAPRTVFFNVVFWF